MAKILHDTTKDMENIEYIFDETIATVEQKADGKVDVTFANHLQRTSFDLVVGADGMMSRTRRYVFGHGPKNDDYLHRLGQYGAFFAIPRTDDDTNFAQWYNATRGRLILKRPDQYGTTRVYMAVTDSNFSRFDEIDGILKKRSVQEQKEWLAKEFEGAGWISERIIKGMMECKDFYMQQIAQVKMPEWSKGHVALLGDAAYCPSPISGVVSNELLRHIYDLTNTTQGAGAAIVGAYVLAGELSKSPEDIPSALKRYEARTRTFVDQVQKLVPGAPQVANPQTSWGIMLFNKTTGFLSHPALRRFGSLVGKFVPAFGGTEWNIPEYGVASKA
jgi:2-polyprenyl-6-methoxyphenol hydroxylase-like FAD-dependent oxidoreductase